MSRVFMEKILFCHILQNYWYELYNMHTAPWRLIPDVLENFLYSAKYPAAFSSISRSSGSLEKSTPSAVRASGFP